MIRAAQFGPLWRHHDFMALWSAQTLSAFGSRITRTALPIIAILTLDASANEIAALSVLSFLPGVIVGLFVGGRVDRAAKRPLMIGADLFRAALILTVPAAAWLGWLAMPQLYLVAALAGAANALFTIADASFLPVIVAKDDLVDANAKLQATDSIAEFAGPGIAGVLIQVLTAPVAVIADAATFLWSALMLGRVRAVEAPAAVNEEAHPWRDIRIGFGAIFASAEVRATFVADAVGYLFRGFFMTLYMLVMLRVAQMSPAVAGLVISCGGIGAFIGSLVAQPMERAFGRGGALLIALAIGQAGDLLIPIAAAYPAFAIACFAAQQIFGDAFLVAYMVLAVSQRQSAMPEAVLGRANAAFQAMQGATLPLGALIAGALTGVLGIVAATWIAAIGGLFAVPAFALANVRPVRSASRPVL